MTWGIEPPKSSSVNWGRLWDGLLTALTVAILILSLLSAVTGRGESFSLFAARFWQVWGGLLKSVARTAGYGALQAESAYWAAIEKVRK